MTIFKTTFLMTALTILFVFTGRAMGGESGMKMAFILAIVMNAGTYWFSDKIVLAMYRAKPVTETEEPRLYQTVRELATRAQIPMPKVYIIPTESPNAFATGRNPHHAAVAVTQGILQLLTPEELKGVLGHELGHVLHRDILIGTVAATFAGAISMLAHMAQWAMIFGGGNRDDRDRGGSPLVGLLMIFLAPLAATLIQLAISRSREYAADGEGARLLGDPLPLASALKKLQRGVQQIPMEAQPSTAHLFIVNPLRGRGLMALFSTHPPMEERIRRLEAMRKNSSH